MDPFSVLASRVALAFHVSGHGSSAGDAGPGFQRVPGSFPLNPKEIWVTTDIDLFFFFPKASNCSSNSKFPVYSHMPWPVGALQNEVE